MKPCPFCGVMLTASLVAAIIDPKQEESCPRYKEPKPVEKMTVRTYEPTADPALRLAAYAMLGSMFGNHRPVGVVSGDTQ